MSYGMQAYDAAGSMMLGPDDMTFRFIGVHSYAPSTSSEVFVSIPGIAAATHFASAGSPNYGLPVVEAGGVRIYPGYFSAASADLHLFRL